MIDKDKQSTPDTSRRRLLKGVVGATPVILAVSSKPVLAGMCRVSGYLSGNLSQPEKETLCGGHSPEYWRYRIAKNDKTTFYNKFGCIWRDGYGIDWPKPTKDKYSTYSLDTNKQAKTPTFYKVLNMLYDEDQYKLGSYAVAAYLNAYNVPGYGLAPDEVKDMVQQVVAFGEYKDPSTGKVLDAQELVAFFAQTFDAD